MPKDGDEMFQRSLARCEGLQRLTKEAVCFGREICSFGLLVSIHYILEQSYLWGATTPLPLIYSALVEAAAISALGMGT